MISFMNQFQNQKEIGYEKNSRKSNRRREKRNTTTF